jgi:Protein of unknown function (DUF2690)
VGPWLVALLEPCVQRSSAAFEQTSNAMARQSRLGRRVDHGLASRRCAIADAGGARGSIPAARGTIVDGISNASVASPHGDDENLFTKKEVVPMIAMRTRSLAVLMATAMLAALGAAAVLAQAAEAHGRPSHGSHVVFRNPARHPSNHPRGATRRRTTTRHAAATVYPDIIPGTRVSAASNLAVTSRIRGATGCDAGAETIGQRPINDSLGNHLGYVELRWSPTCQTNWARVTSTSGASSPTHVLEVEIQRQSDGTYEDLDTEGDYSDAFSRGGAGGNGGPVYHGVTSLYTDMLYSPGPAKAIGKILPGANLFGPTGIYSQF